MEERNFLIVIETLTDKISFLKYDNERLHEENASLRATLEAIAKGVVEEKCDER